MCVCAHCCTVAYFPPPPALPLPRSSPSSSRCRHPWVSKCSLISWNLFETSKWEAGNEVVPAPSLYLPTSDRWGEWGVGLGLGGLFDLRMRGWLRGGGEGGSEGGKDVGGGPRWCGGVGELGECHQLCGVSPPRKAFMCLAAPRWLQHFDGRRMTSSSKLFIWLSHRVCPALHYTWLAP